MFRLLCEDIIYVRLSVLHVKSVFILEDILSFVLLLTGFVMLHQLIAYKNQPLG